MLVVGDVMLDEHIQGDVRRLSPEAPVPIVEIQSRRFHPGGAANVAANISSLRGSVLLVGIVGTDSSAARLLEELSSRAVSSDYLIAVADRRTTTKSRVMAGGQHIVRFDEECRMDLSPEQEELLANAVAQCVRDADACIISDYAKGVATTKVCQSVIAAASSKHIPVVVDPKGTNYGKYAGASVITPNLKEAIAVAGAYDNRFHAGDDSGILIEDIAETIMRRCETSLLITRGSEGMSLFERGAPPVTIRARARQVYDVTGAGDTVVATLALGLAAGLSLEQASRIGNLAAGIVVGELGAATVSPETLHRAIDNEQQAKRGFASLP
ncbi:MAG: D-glycero-beta-D-manno-heptose-7-phosphate kinase [Verrucomicrobia bacterium]|nr:D-glycero-beta-D-manno-heptose-7-phosphate kinase [Verrucomicrobiota bacterium]